MGNLVSYLIFGGDDLSDFQREKLKKLKHYDTILIIDDSSSMEGSRWDEARKAVLRLVKVAVKYDRNGIDVYFLNSKLYVKNCKCVWWIMWLFWRVSPCNSTPLGSELDEHLEAYLDEYAVKKKAAEKSIVSNPLQNEDEPNETARIMKPASFLVVTDGRPDSEPDVKNAILNSIKRQEKLEAPERQIGIQFVQIGNDPGASLFLDYLDNDLPKENKKARDMVDTVKQVPGQDLDLVKALIGSIDKLADQRDQVFEGK